MGTPCTHRCPLITWNEDQLIRKQAWKNWDGHSCSIAAAMETLGRVLLGQETSLEKLGRVLLHHRSGHGTLVKGTPWSGNELGKNGKGAPATLWRPRNPWEGYNLARKQAWEKWEGCLCNSTEAMEELGKVAMEPTRYDRPPEKVHPVAGSEKDEPTFAQVTLVLVKAG